MLAAFIWLFFLFMLEGLVAGEYCRAANEPPCVNYIISFDPDTTTKPEKVYLDETVIGKAAHAASQAGTSTDFRICIDRAYSKHIEQGTIGYIAEDKIHIYNVWASGEKLGENGRLEGFSNKFHLYTHELKSIAVLFLRFFGWGQNR